MAARACATLGLLALLVAAGCGGDDDSGPSKAEIVKETDEICVEAIDEAREYTRNNPPPKPSEGPAKVIEETVRIGEDAVGRFEELDPPAEGKEDFESFLDGQTAALATNRDLLREAEASNPKGFADASRGLREEAEQIKSAGEAYGLEEASKCARIALPIQVPAGAAAPPEGSAAGERNTTGITGSWSGEGTETRDQGKLSRYPVEIEITSLEEGADAGSVNYPSFPCSGRLRLDERRGDAYIFDEEITANKSRCELQGRVQLSRNGERLSYRWSTPRTKDLTVRAELESR